MGSLAVTHGCTLLRQSVKLCTAKLYVENQSKTYRDQSYPNAFRVKLSVLSRSNHSRQQATLQHTLCFSRSGLSQRVSLGIQFTYCSKVTKTKEWFLCKRQTGFPSLDEIPKSDPEDQKLLFSSKNSFFSSVAADLALRLGPDSERSGKKVCKKYETLWLHNRRTSWKHKNNENKQKNGNSDDPQISRPDLRFASRENSETTQNGAGATPNKNHTNPWGLPPDTIGSSPPCLRNMHKRIKSLWPKQIKRG